MRVAKTQSEGLSSLLPEAPCVQAIRICATISGHAVLVSPRFNEYFRRVLVSVTTNVEREASSAGSRFSCDDGCCSRLANAKLQPSVNSMVYHMRWAIFVAILGFLVGICAWLFFDHPTNRVNPKRSPTLGTILLIIWLGLIGQFLVFVFLLTIEKPIEKPENGQPPTEQL